MSNPAIARRNLQIIYDSYMSGERLTIGRIKDITPFITDDLDERDEKIAAVAELYPKKTQPLVRKMLHEALFFEACIANHRFGARNALAPLKGLIGEVPFAYASGMGRNAIGVTILSGSKLEPYIIGSDFAMDFIHRQGDNVRLILDPDFGVGHYGAQGLPTPRATAAQTPVEEGGWVKFV